MIRPLLTILLLSLVLAGSPAIADNSGESPSEFEEHFIDAGQYTLYLKVYRGGDRVVLMEAGGGMDSSNWDHLAPRILAETGATVVTYDRPGFGQSDLPDIPCDMREESQSLWCALAKLQLDQKVLAVGYSYGGWMTRLHANDHPEQVMGVVLVDPFNCVFVESHGVEYWDQHPMTGNLPFDTSDPSKLTDEQKGLARMVGEGLGPKVAIMKDTEIPPGIPVRLISSRQTFFPEEKEQEAWWASHDQVAASIEGCVLIEALESNHGVPFQQPDLVMEAIVAVREEGKP